MAMPIMGTLFIQMAYTLIDMAWLGRLGSKEVAAVGAVGILTWMTNSFSLLNKVGAEVGVGQSIGAHDAGAARAYASHVITLAIIMAVAWGTLLFTLAYPAVRLYNLEEDITRQTVGFLRIIVFGFPFIFLSAAFTGIYNAAGRTNIPFYANGAGLILNIILDPVFIFVLDFGMSGAAIATCLAQGTVIAIFIYLKGRGQNRLLGGFPFFTALKRQYTARIFRLGLPVALLNSLFSLINLLMGRTASTYGGHIGLMTLTTGGQIEGIAWYSSQGFSTALSAFVAQNFAAGKMERVGKALKATLWLSVSIGTASMLLFMFFGANIFSVIVPEVEAYTAGGIFLRIDSYSMILMMIEISMQGVFYGIGRTIPPAVISISGNLMRIPLAAVLASTSLGLAGVWWAISITSMLKGIAAVIWYIKIRRTTTLN
jgi:putative MATE family efflux protein